MTPRQIVDRMTPMATKRTTTYTPVATMAIREFVRGGYRTITRPTELYAPKGVRVGMFIPDKWTVTVEIPSWLSGQEGDPRAQDQEA